MDTIEKIKKESIEEFSSQSTQEQYGEIAEKGLWESEKVLISKLEFGDWFFERNYLENGQKRWQFIHFTSQKEMEEIIKESGFAIVMRERMGEISKKDAEAMQGSMSKDFNSFKSPIFYICVK